MAANAFLGLRCNHRTRDAFKECRALAAALGDPSTSDAIALRVFCRYRRVLRGRCNARRIDWRAIAAGINDPRPPHLRGPITHGPPRRQKPMIDE